MSEGPTPIVSGRIEAPPAYTDLFPRVDGHHWDRSALASVVTLLLCNFCKYNH